LILYCGAGQVDMCWSGGWLWNEARWAAVTPSMRAYQNDIPLLSNYVRFTKEKCLLESS